MRLETRLHRARVERGINLSDLAARTRLSPRVVQRIDEGRFAELPAGVYARSYVRAFASEVGLDPDGVVQDLLPELPTVDDPLDGLRDARTARLDGTVYSARTAAAACDAALLFAIDAVLVLLTAAICGVDVAVLLRQAAAALAVYCAVPVALYFIVFAGIGGRTPGERLCRLPVLPAANPLRVSAILRRTVRV